MKKTHWREIKQTDFLGSHDLNDGSGGFREITATIKQAEKQKVKDINGDDSVELVLTFTDGLKPMILNVTNSRTLAKLFKSSYIEDWAGKAILIGTEKVKAFGEMHDALRIRKRLPVSTKSAGKCADCKGDIVAVGMIKAEQIKEGTQKTYGADLCWNCANIRKKEKADVDEG